METEWYLICRPLVFFLGRPLMYLLGAVRCTGMEFTNIRNRLVCSPPRGETLGGETPAGEAEEPAACQPSQQVNPSGASTSGTESPVPLRLKCGSKSTSATEERSTGAFAWRVEGRKGGHRMRTGRRVGRDGAVDTEGHMRETGR